MQSIAASPSPRKPVVQASWPAFSVVAIHDGFFASIRSMEALEWLKFTLSSELRVCPASWSFDTLKRQDERTTAVRAAAAADLLLISAPDDTPLPDHIKRWLDAIPQQQRSTRPILAALHKEDFELNGAQGPLCSHLKEVARIWRTEFLCNSDFDQRLDCGFASKHVRRKGTSTFHLAKPFCGEFPSTPRYWGING